ncbi:HAMP domain-containing sensor histidine kinase [Alicyclobacillus curvatus]|nr:HAMP domain-containing sensor histidine kinase [Alicyclobacillus curvatus]
MTTRGKVLLATTLLPLLSALTVMLWMHLFDTLGAWGDAGILGIWLIIGFGVGYTVTQPLLRRLYNLEEAAGLIAAGRLHHRIERVDEGDEISRIGRQFNLMAAQIEEQVRTLRRLAEENRLLAAEAEQLATVHERQRLARELHDSVSQQLFALAMLASSALKQEAKKSGTLASTISQISDIANAAQREMRALLLHLRPVELEGRRFDEAAKSFLSAVAERHNLKCTFIDKMEVPLEPAVEEQLFRMLQEAVSNVLKHAEASTVQVTWEPSGTACKLTIMDDGVGIPDLDDSGDSYGIRMMKERALALGGRCDFWRPAKGTAVEIQIPMIDGGESGV